VGAAIVFPLVQRDEKRKKSRGRKRGQPREEKKKRKEKEIRTHQQKLQFEGMLHAVSPMRGMLCLPDGGHNLPDCCRVMLLEGGFSKKKKELEGKKRISCKSRAPQLHPEEWMGKQKLEGRS
jgi:hypothetical protein